MFTIHNIKFLIRVIYIYFTYKRLTLQCRVFIDKKEDILYKITIMNDRKLKIHLDTSVISYLKQDDVPEKTGVTLNLWEKFKTDVYDIFISQMLIVEVNNCDEPKRTFLLGKLNEIKYKNLQLKNSTYGLAN